MAHPSGDHPPKYLATLIERGTLIPARRRLSKILAAHPPLKFERSQVTTARALDEQSQDPD